jgi:hypothetical protein
MEKFIKLMKLALNQTGGIIHDFLNMYIGMWGFIVFFGSFIIINTNAYGGPIGTLPDPFVLIIWNAFVNTVSYLTFFLIVICLAIYAVSFTHLCYLYDGKSWEIGVQFRKFIAWRNKNWDKIDKNRAEYQKDLDDEIAKIKESASPGGLILPEHVTKEE